MRKKPNNRTGSHSQFTKTWRSRDDRRKKRRISRASKRRNRGRDRRKN